MDTPFIITERALIARIRRHLRKSGRRLLKCRADSRWHNQLGDYHILGANNCIEHTHVDLRQLGLDLGVLQDHEEVSHV